MAFQNFYFCKLLPASPRFSFPHPGQSLLCGLEVWSGWPVKKAFYVSSMVVCLWWRMVGQLGTYGWLIEWLFNWAPTLVVWWVLHRLGSLRSQNGARGSLHDFSQPLNFDVWVNEEFRNKEILYVIMILATAHYLVLAHSLPVLHTTLKKEDDITKIYDVWGNEKVKVKKLVYRAWTVNTTLSCSQRASEMSTWIMTTRTYLWSSICIMTSCIYIFDLCNLP